MKVANLPALMYGLLFCGAGFSSYFIGVMLGFIRIFVDPHGQWKWFIEQILWYSGIPVIAGIILILGDLFLLLPKKRMHREVLGSTN